MLTVIKKSGEPFFVSIVSCSHRTPEQAAAEIEEQHRLTGLENFAVSFSLQPQSLGGDPLKKAGIINEVADTVADIPDAIKRQVYIDAVAQQVGDRKSVV